MMVIGVAMILAIAWDEFMNRKSRSRQNST